METYQISFIVSWSNVILDREFIQLSTQIIGPTNLTA